jgi:two-component system, OmpR family, alkaline phosphatase synthesis response regulator PhoP
MSRILLADDSKFFRTIERQFLQKTPAELAEVASSDELMTTLRKSPPHLLFAGFTLRPLNAAECCRQIKADPVLRSLPVVIVCDQGDDQQLAEAKSSNCDAVLVKPLDRTSFLRMGRRFLTSIREHRQPCFMAVRFNWQDQTINGKCLDISGGGMFLETPADVPVGTLLTLEFILPSGMNLTSSCQGEVMWLNRKPNLFKPHYPVGMGVRFDAPSKLLIDEISRYMKI